MHRREWEVEGYRLWLPRPQGTAGVSDVPLCLTSICRIARNTAIARTLTTFRDLRHYTSWNGFCQCDCQLKQYSCCPTLSRTIFALFDHLPQCGCLLSIASASPNMALPSAP